MPRTTVIAQTRRSRRASDSESPPTAADGRRLSPRSRRTRTPRALSPIAAAGANIEAVAARRTRRIEPALLRRGAGEARPRRSRACALVLCRRGARRARAACRLARRRRARRCRRPPASTPRSALPVNLRGLAFADVETTQEMHEGVHGAGGRRRDRQRREDDRRGAAAALLACAMAAAPRSTPGPRCRHSRSLAPGETLRVPQPPRLAAGETRSDVQVRFFNRRDLTRASEARWRRSSSPKTRTGLRDLIRRALARMVTRSSRRRTAREALELLTRERGAFDLLLTDIKMPVMDGIALALAAARDEPKLSILLMTGYADQRERAHDLEALIQDVIAKPFTLSGAVRRGGRRADAKGVGSEILQQPLDVLELELRAQRVGRSGGAVPRGCGARAARRSRPAPSR